MRRKDRPPAKDSPGKDAAASEDRPQRSSSLATGTAERLAAIVEAAEQAAVTVIDDAEREAREHLERAEAEADRLVAERLSSLTDLTDTLVAQGEEIRDRSEQLLASLEEARRRLGAAEGSEPQQRGTHLSAVAAVEEPVPAEAIEPGADVAEVATPAGARLLATQMAVSGSSRAEIDARLRNGFEIEDTAAILDAILGPED
jgi:vacuolar-type H+-ATPase subunit H